jgi:protein-S-isoprenylcysteine O-methyltransferase Ste14
MKREAFSHLQEVPMSPEKAYAVVLALLFVAVPVVFGLLLIISAPYGRHNRGGWGPALPARAAWTVMELPAVLTILLTYALSGTLTTAGAALLVLWEVHYLYRTILYPALMRGGAKPFPLVVAATAAAFNVANGFANGWSLASHAVRYSTTWLFDWRFLAGSFLFFVGFLTHVRSDRTLRKLRKPGESCYRVPDGGLFRYVSSPNYLGEIVQWVGWALASWSLAGLAFAAFTAANLVPRAVAHHRWYRRTFSSYPEERKAVIPFLL